MFGANGAGLDNFHIFVGFTNVRIVFECVTSGRRTRKIYINQTTIRRCEKDKIMMISISFRPFDDDRQFGFNTVDSSLFFYNENELCVCKCRDVPATQQCGVFARPKTDFETM